MSYKSKTDKQILELYNSLVAEKKPIPIKLVQEVGKRRLIKTYRGTYHS